VLDAAAVFAIDRAEPPQRIAIVEHDGCRAGLAVDSVIGVDHLPEATEEVASSHLSGALLHDGALVGVVDVPAVFGAVRGALT
jgi:chemotaxis signal transduction protein